MFQIWVVAGSRVVEFCRGYPTYLLQPPKSNQELFLNDIQNDAINTIEDVNLRGKRNVGSYYNGRVRGQTQSQYLNFGNGHDPGKAEAEASYGTSRAVVSK